MIYYVIGIENLEVSPTFLFLSSIHQLLQNSQSRNIRCKNALVKIKQYFVYEQQFLCI